MPSIKRQFSVESISELTIARLSIYLRCVDQLEALGIETVSSQELAQRFNLNSAQIRKDLAYFGEFGVRGVGYSVRELRHYLTEILGLNREHRVLIVGAGNLGTALCHYSRFASESFLVVAILDSDPRKIGEPTPGGLLVEDASRLGEIVRQREVEIGVITTPPDTAQRVCDQMVAAHLRAVLNFAPVQVKGPKSVLIRSVDLKVHLEELSFYLTHGMPK
ncbi:MAG: redox-sensing transcriptional repressor Rex [Acidobacteria bacterium]|nr:redox-sensing transcriptional repressor Rex [Acidobacteriota bacterium]